MDDYHRAPVFDPAAGAAARYLDAVNARLIGAACARRQGHRDNGARAPLGLGADPVRLGVVKDHQGPQTPLGYKTARRALPRNLAPILGDLALTDPRRVAVDLVADVVERLSGAGGADWLGGDTKAALSDGGATTRCRLAARWRIIEAAANEWEISTFGRITRGAETLALPVRRKRGNRQPIKAIALVLGLCADGLSLAEILARHGWPEHSKHTRALRLAALEVLDRVAKSLGH
ncbi:MULTISPECIES: hypothetical protein [unclassified Sulfitobacter]|uniref:hypothetical protein n=1 Tax=unclassified Sulfitobacter TaxID=196795 RepID=UPI0023E14B6D|nr:MULTISPECIES: hypothetical protein [unclassified Sulfitobacter]MDF3383352.1 hypothetical protein [Sulfitobacter sp. Ks11]MDF3386771.1 hypothetical protein [Sulfitobacter sp. M85]MDF3390190.1 hypothetical protein [Sulfitobacter sp. Ks16]MDF3400827.1 hypothetical protein [Sulfitobacter sp. KE39]MDF3404248.1 hypothetical protein [Sulfitobacter sp. Ks35]